MNLTRKKRSRLKVLPLILIISLLLLFTGCQKQPSEASEATTLISLPTEAPDSTSTDAASQDTSQIAATAEKSDKSSASEAASQSPSDLIPEDGTYTTKEDVALYIHTYGKLPQNFITKKAAKKLGWQGGSLEDYAPGKCIGGDYFGNYEGLLPEDKEYHECDIGTLGKSKRGAKRIIYSDDGYIYYTSDHYESFELLYEP